MKLTLYTDYAIRTLVMLARQAGERITIAEVASELQVSHNHLVKVVNELVAAGWVTSVRGKNGGINLAVCPSSLTLAQVVDRTEKDTGSAFCMDGAGKKCGAANDCNLKFALNIARNRYMAALAEVSIDQLLATTSQWRRRLQEDASAIGVKAATGAASPLISLS